MHEGSAADDWRLQRRTRLDRAIADQRSFLYRVPDPDTRERAEGHLLQLIHMRNELNEESATAA